MTVAELSGALAMAAADAVVDDLVRAALAGSDRACTTEQLGAFAHARDTQPPGSLRDVRVQSQTSIRHSQRQCIGLKCHLDSYFIASTVARRVRECFLECPQHCNLDRQWGLFRRILESMIDTQATPPVVILDSSQRHIRYRESL